MFDLSLMGRLTFKHAAPTQSPLPPGRNFLGIADERDAILYVPEALDLNAPIPLMVMFHGASQITRINLHLSPRPPQPEEN